ncbi:glycosyltransferase family 2 protein [Pseudoalteromonas sp. C2R02]|uniref:glycosyltransferase family 2 protein n=1 Tax=Pseudoalteromonas sp. C2R02 TaxID=2841565 RepID=UPI001C0984D9|nr:glycosyltransferase family A protein [Pseudoalteromonas sp. C2R02]MBU2972627.1 glycosyltransferase family 2 protein [Pseudoalteromonas sp. C2R02]
MTHQITIAVATMDLGVTQYKLPSIALNNEVNLLIAHQISSAYTNHNFEDAYNKIKNQVANATIISSHELGLSKSRNLAIDHCDTKYIVFSDDDNTYIEQFSSTIKKYQSQLNDPEFISFQIHDKNGIPFKDYSDQLKTHTNVSAMRISSIENIVNCDFLKKHNIYFDESFGLGAKYPSCEQPIFLAQLLKAGAQAYYVPEPLAIHPKEHSGLDFYTQNNAQTRGQMFIKVFGAIKGRILACVFMIKKIKEVPPGMRATFIKGVLGL